MRTLTNLFLMFLLAVSAASMQGRILNAAAGQQGDEQSASPQQQSQESAQAPTTGSTTVQTVTGCVVKTDNGFSLKTDSDTYPIEADQDLSQYVNKQIRITGLLEHHTTAPASTSTPSMITDIRLRTIVSVVGDCNQQSK